MDIWEEGVIKGKMRIQVLLNNAVTYQTNVNTIQARCPNFQTHQTILDNLTSDTEYFDKKRTDKMVNHYKNRVKNNTRPVLQ